MVIQGAALISPSGNMDNTVHDHTSEVPHPEESPEPSAAVDETTSGGGSAAAIGLLHVVRDSANGFGPLKYIASRLCLVLENCKV